MKRIVGLFLMVCGFLLLISTFDRLGIGNWLFSGKPISKSVSHASIEKISIDTPVQVNVLPENRKDITVVANGKKIKLIDLEIKKTNKQIQFRIKKHWLFWFVEPNQIKLTLYIPADFHQNLSIQGSGDLQIHGDSPTKKWKLAELKVSLHSGNSKFQNLQVDRFNYHHSIGNIQVKDVASKQTLLNVGQGDITFSRYSGMLKIGLIKGNLRAHFSSLTKSLETDVQNGNTFIDLPSEIPFLIYAHTSHGTIDCRFPIQGKKTNQYIKGKYQDGRSTVINQTRNGNIYIY
ncbi:DUF4097 family beta strand repeat-containing protein [Thermoflavimicrobium daqui]|uniref:DUF4097 domain-containing protein n=1 Tax=Thermoflavimicrobium daqui TaxID=2137476 RepID=A0A364K3Q4_9BACL|nr:DUF4097 family beta strand repeat-containing protein [Thermoflavimicrobium daqui]RAL23434.1 hypothetical protein DL897_12185 [Thermoflavimicrobium daqui]